MALCPHCFGSGRIPLPLLLEREAQGGIVCLPIALFRPCDYPSCHGGVINCSEPPVNRFQGLKAHETGTCIGSGEKEVPAP